MKYGMRERVSGIIIVIALLIIFIPLLMSEPEPRESRPEPALTVERPVEVPRHSLEDPAPPLRLETSGRESGSGQVSESQTEQASAPSSSQTQATETTAPQDTKRPADDPIARLAREAEQRQAASSTDSSATDSSAARSTPGGEWAVQVGSFGKPANASGLEKRLNEKGYPAYQRDRGNNLTSVYVGPFATSEAAESVMAKLKAELNQQGLLVRTGR